MFEFMPVSAKPPLEHRAPRPQAFLPFAGLPAVSLLGQSVLNLTAIGVVAALFRAAEQHLFPLAEDPVPDILPPQARSPGLPAPDAALPDDGPVIQRRYTWDFRPQGTGRGRGPRRFSLGLTISQQRYEMRANEAREPDPMLWTKYAATPMPELDLLAARFLQLNLQERLEPFDQAGNVLAFAQECVVYQYDHEKHPDQPEYPQYPIESLVERSGDCEDHAILAAAILSKMGFEVGLILAPGHCALGLACMQGTLGDGYVRDNRTGLTYYYGETTAAGWRFGQMPNDLRGSQMTILPVKYEVAPPGGA